MSKATADALLDELRQLYRGTRALHWPDELDEALRYARRHRTEITDGAARVREALIRVELWEYVIRQHTMALQADQCRAVEDAKEAGAGLQDLAGPLRVSGKSGARQKYLRQLAPALRDEAGRPLRRTPEAVTQALRRQEHDRAADLHRQAAEGRRHHLVARAVDQLLTHRDALNADPEHESDWWLDQAQAVMDYGCGCAASAAAMHTCPLTPLARANLALYLQRAVQYLQQAEQPDDLPEPARAAWTAARAIADETASP